MDLRRRVSDTYLRDHADAMLDAYQWYKEHRPAAGCAQIPAFGAHVGKGPRSLARPSSALRPDGCGARCPVPVSLDVDLDGRLPDVVEQIAYFVAAEALTNVAKHSGATQATVTVDSDGERVRVRVTDDGRGGAHAGKGHGLAGLADRVAAAEGWFDLHSPPGGPTLVTAGIPLTGPG